MKKIIFFTVLAFILTVPAFALAEQSAPSAGILPEENVQAYEAAPDGDSDISEPGDTDGGFRFKTAGDLWQYWQNQNSDYYESCPYPDYICGVWSTDGGMENLTFAVTKDSAGEAGKEEILSAVEDKTTVSFTYLSYSYKELWTIRMELEPRMGGDSGIVSMGIYEDKNVLHIGVDEDNPNSRDFMDECFRRFGNRIEFETGQNILDITASEYAPEKGQGGGISKWLWSAAAFAVGIAMLYMLFGKRLMIVCAGAGEAALQSARAGRAEVERAVKSSLSRPSDKLKGQIFEALKRDL